MSIIIGGDTDISTLASLAKTSAVQVSITHPVPAFTVAVTGTGDKELVPTTATFVDVLNGYSEIVNFGSTFTVLADGRIQANKNVVCLVDGYADVTHSANSATVGVAFSIEKSGVRYVSGRSVHARVPNTGDIGNISGNGIAVLAQGDILGLAVASDVTGNVSFKSSTLNVLEIIV